MFVLLSKLHPQRPKISPIFLHYSKLRPLRQGFLLGFHQALFSRPYSEKITMASWPSFSCLHLHSSFQQSGHTFLLHCTEFGFTTPTLTPPVPLSNSVPASISMQKKASLYPAKSRQALLPQTQRHLLELTWISTINPINPLGRVPVPCQMDIWRPVRRPRPCAPSLAEGEMKSETLREGTVMDLQK